MLDTVADPTRPGLPDHRYALKRNEAEARERLRAFWAGQSLGDRPALHVTVRNPDWRPPPVPELPDDLKLAELLPALHVHRAASLKSKIHLAEAMPVVETQFGRNLPLLPVLAGGDYSIGADGHVWVEPVEDLFQRDLPTFDPQHPVIRALSDAIRAMAEVIGRQGFVNPPVIGVEPLTALSLMRGAETFCMDLLEQADCILAWRDALSEIYVRCYEHFYQLLFSLGYGETTTWLPAMAEGRCEAVQCDAAVMFSPEMFERFALPDLRRQTGYLDYALYHLDGTAQMRFIEQLASLDGLNGIQWNPEPDAGSIVDWIDAFKQIRQLGLSLLINRYEVKSLDEAVAVARALGPDGLLIALPTFETTQEAEAAIQTIADASRMSEVS